MAHKQETDNGMQFILNDLGYVATKGLNNSVYHSAIQGLTQKLFTSSLFILPTRGIEETIEVYRKTQDLLQKASRTLDEFIKRKDEQITCQGEAVTLKNFIDTVMPAAKELAEFTIKEPADKEDKDGTAIRSAFVHFPHHNHCTEKDYSMEVECGGCAVVIKEFRGYQMRLVRRVITRWIEPWFSRRRLITKIVWVIEWVPAEYIKTITVDCCSKGKKRTQVDQRLVIDRGLMTFWRCH